MNIQIDGAGFNNKGSELMLLAVLERLNSEAELNPQFIFHSRSSVDVQFASALKMKQLYTVYRYKIPFYKLLPEFLYQDYGIVSYKRTDHILDVGGYQIGDPWRRSKRYFSILKTLYRNVKNKEGKIIYLPQAFGPFEEQYSQDHLKLVFEYADLMYCRDQQSLSYLENSIGKSSKVKLAPDFTLNLVAPQNQGVQSKNRSKLGIIPNAKMYQYKPKRAKEDYINFLKELITQLQSQQFEVVIINHEGSSDEEIIKILQVHFPDNVPALLQSNALDLKSVIGSLDFLYSDRYHGVINGLTQGIPTISSGWSHKYSELFDTYNFPEGMISMNLNEAMNKVFHWKEINRYAFIQEKLKNAKDRVKTEVEAMWIDIINLLK